MEEDEPLLTACDSERRALLTNNVADFTVIVRRWAVEGRLHSGLIFTSDRSLPRGRSTIGKYVELLDDLLSSNSKDDAFVDRVHWLTDPALPRLTDRRGEHVGVMGFPGHGALMAHPGRFAVVRRGPPVR